MNATFSGGSTAVWCVVAALAWGATGACSADDPSGSAGSFGRGGAGGAAGSGASGGAVVPVDAGEVGGGGPGDCAEAAKYVYVLDATDKLYRFDPTIQSPSAFQLVGPIHCAGEGAPNSMAIARDGFAYVLYGKQGMIGSYSCVGVNKVNILNADCVGATPFTCDQHGFRKFGMGYATDGPDTTAETLYIGSSLDSRFGSLDAVSGQVSPLPDLPVRGPEFTGNQKGELWGFFPYEDPPRILQIHKSDGSALQTFLLDRLTSVSNAREASWAFAFWGGSFYVFYRASPPDDTTNVYKFEYDGSMETYIPDTGLNIVGAGVSTCAPVTVR